MSLDPRVEGELEDMLNVLRDGVRGYNAAIGAIEDRGIAVELKDLRAAREQMFAELAETAGGHGVSADAADDGTLGGALHRSWLKMQSVLTAGDQAILDAVEEGEEHAVALFRRTVDAELPDDVLILTESHLERLSEALTRTRHLIATASGS